MILIAIAATESEAAKVVTVHSESIVIGRDQRSDVVLAARGVSSKHCRLSPMHGVAGAFMLEDLGSTYGTFVNGARVGRPVVVSRADQITVGEHPIRIAEPGYEAEALAAVSSGPAAPPASSPSTPGFPASSSPSGSAYPPSSTPSTSGHYPPSSTPSSTGYPPTSSPSGYPPTSSPSGYPPTSSPSGYPPSSSASAPPGGSAAPVQPQHSSPQPDAAGPQRPELAGTDWASQYSYYDALAKTWDRQGRRGKDLLRGKDLNGAVGWLRAGRDLRPGPTSLHRDFVETSKKAGRRRFAWVLGGLVAVAIIGLNVAAVLNPDRARQILAKVDRDITEGDSDGDETTPVNGDPDEVVAFDFEALITQSSNIKDPDQRLMAYAELASRAPLDEFFGPSLGDLQRKIHQDLATRRELVLSAEGSPVSTVAFGPAGRWAIAGAENNEAMLWDLRAPAPARPMRLHTNMAPITAVGISRSGHWALSCDEDGGMVRWDLTAKDPAAAGVKLEGHKTVIRGLVFDHSDQWAVTIDDLGTVAIWDVGPSPSTTTANAKVAGHADAAIAVVANPGGGFFTGGDDTRVYRWSINAVGRPRKNLALEHDTGVTAIAVDPDGRWLVTGEGSGNVTLWDLKSKRLTKPFGQLIGHTEAISALGISPDKEVIVTASDDDTMRIWELKNSDPSASSIVAKGHTGDITAIGFAGGGTRLVSGALDTSVRVRDLAKRHLSKDEYLLEGHTDGVLALDISPDGLWALTGAKDGTVRAWDLLGKTGGQSGRVLRGASTAVSDAALDSGGDRMLVVGGGGRVELWDLQDASRFPRPIRYPGAEGTIATADISVDGYVAAGGFNNKIYYWPLVVSTAPSEPRVLSGHEGPVNSVRFTPDGKKLVSVSSDRSLIVWPTDTLSPQKLAVVHADEIGAFAMDPDGRFVFTGSLDGTIVRWDLQAPDGAPVKLEQKHDTRRAITALEVSADGRWMASSSEDRNVWVWDVDSGKARHRLKEHDEPADALAFSRSGRWLASGGRDKRIVLWDLESKEPDDKAATFDGHTQSVNALAFLDGVELLASASNDGTVRLWPVSGGDPLVFQGHDSSVTGLRVPANGRLVSVSIDGSARVWPTSGPVLADRICQAIGLPLEENLSQSLFSVEGDKRHCALDRPGG